MQMRKQVKYNIPFYSQEVHQDTYEQDGFNSFEEALSWEKRGCGIASIRMIIDGFKNELNQNFCERHGAMIHKGLSIAAYKENIGWIHHGLCNLASEYGIAGQAYRGKTIVDIKEEIEKGHPCIASVTPRFMGGLPNEEEGGIWNTGGHLIVVYGILLEDEQLKALVVNHPSCFDNCNWENMEVDAERFAASFSGNFMSFWLPDEEAVSTHNAQ